MPTKELGEMQLFLIYATAGEYEPLWRAIQGLPLTESFTVTTKATFDHALRGWTSPFVKGLSLPPVGALKKLPVLNRLCENRQGCPMYHKAECTPSHKKMPWCFQPSGLESDEQRRLASEVVQMWRAGVYIVVVDDP